MNSASPGLPDVQMSIVAHAAPWKAPFPAGEKGKGGHFRKFREKLVLAQARIGTLGSILLEEIVTSSLQINVQQFYE